MALRIWLPLIGSQLNKGTSGEPTWSTAAGYVSTGKIGSQSLSSGAAYLTAAQTASILNNNEFSFACWVYVNADTGDTSKRYMYFGTSGMGANNNRKFSIFQYPTVNDVHLSWMNDTASTTYIATVYSGVVPSRTWTHIAVTYKNPNGCVYINGNLIATFSGVSSSSSFAYQTPMFENAGGNKYLQDYRIYDHCLSDAEVKKISKALIVHYKLDSQYETTLRNKYSTPYSDGCSSGGSFTRTQLTNERGYNYKYTYTGNGSNSWPSWYVPNFSFTVGKRYFYSVKVRCNKWTAGSISLRASRSNNDWVTNSVVICSSSQVDGKWHEYYVSQVVNETYERSGTVTCNPVLEFYCSNLNGNGTLYDFDFDVKDVQVVESDVYIPFIDNGQSNTTVDDCSGFGYNGTINNTVIPSSNTARNKISYYFDGVSSAITVPFNTALGVTEASIVPYSISAWFYVAEQSSEGYATLFGGPSGFEIETKNAATAGPTVVGWNWGKPSTTYTYNAWHHLVMTHNSSESKWYLNGVLFGTGSAYNIPIGSYFIGAWRSATEQNYKGYVSDFRIYATVLSADDVYNLYKAEAKVAKYEDLHTYTFSEEDSESISNTGVVRGHAIYECPSSSTLKYDKTIYTEPDGSKWVRIFHHNDPTDYKFSNSSSWKDGVYVDANRWFDVYGNVELAPKYELMLKQKTTSSATEVKYRWIQSVSPLTATYNDVKPASVTRITTSGYTDGTFGGLYILNSNTHMVIANTSNGNWYGAIGCWTAYNGGIPGYPNTTVTSGYMDLYMRVYTNTKIIKNTGFSASHLVEM